MDETPAGSLPLPEREAVLEHAAALILKTWRSFDSARAGHPPQAVDHAAQFLDRSRKPHQHKTADKRDRS